MAKKLHTIDTLTDDVERFKRTVNRRILGLKSSLDEIEPKVSEMHDFIVESRGYDRGSATARKDGNINISKDVWGIIKWLILVILAIAGIKVMSP